MMMNIDLADYDRKVREAIRVFWRSRDAARNRQITSGKTDRGERAGVTAGKNMDAFISLFIDIVCMNGMSAADVFRERAVLTLPGYFRPTKLWDLLVIHGGELVAALELKSHIGPSFGNNFNNRAEEAIGTSLDLWTAYRKGSFGVQIPPFVGWFMFVEDAVESRSPIREHSPHFLVSKDFAEASYLKRYDLLCQKLMQERLYTAASVIASPKNVTSDAGEYSTLSPMTGIGTFLASLAGHIAAAATRIG